MRSLKQVQQAEKEFFDRVWLDRHRLLREEGHDVSPGEDAEARIITEYGEPPAYSEYEWGMVEGKLSALRWVLGDEWDSLDT